MANGTKNFIIKYSVYDTKGNVIKWGKMKVKNKLSELQAKCGLEDYLKKKMKNFHKLVIHECNIDWGLYTDDSNCGNIFNDIFGL